MVEERHTGCLAVSEKNGLRLVADILENYGIDSETDVSVLDQDDFRKLASKMISASWGPCMQAVRARAEKMLPSSLTTPAAAALLSSEALTHSVVTARVPETFF